MVMEMPELKTKQQTNISKKFFSVLTRRYYRRFDGGTCCKSAVMCTFFGGILTSQNLMYADTWPVRSISTHFYVGKRPKDHYKCCTGWSEMPNPHNPLSEITYTWPLPHTRTLPVNFYPLPSSFSQYCWGDRRQCNENRLSFFHANCTQ